ncbi:MAG: hypothetical protein ISR69_01925 [Gammaproteobacteria bacterium]|nr:hypothetical protein [Gammaproteobacteria bacterium]
MLKTYLILMVLSSTLLLVSNISKAEQLAIPGHIAAQSTIELPKRGESMDQIRTQFGNPNKELFPVGNPPITQWEYDNFNVFFERQHVIHAINMKTLIMPQY